MSRVRKVFSRKGKMERKQDEVSTEPKAKPIDITAGLNSQAGCPLFTTIPPEVRNYIFLLALSPCEDLKRPYSLNAFFYRPDTQYALITDIALLCTCRRIYGEARLVPWRTREHILWGGHPSRCPPSAPKNPTHFFSSIQPELKRELGPVRLFTQLWWLESSFATLCAHRDASESLRVLRVTLRNSDWWYWEYNQPLKLKRDWTNGLKELQMLETFELEMEAIERDKQQLMDIVKDVLTWRIPAYGGRTFLTNNKPASQLQWLGTSEPKGSHVVYDHAQNLWVGTPTQFPVVESQTGRVTVPKPPARPPLKYEVVLIRWKLERVEG